jgi:predicted dehydrogenase
MLADVATIESRRPCRVGFVGSGRIAREHAKAFRDIPGVYLVGVASRTATNARTFAEEFGIPIVSANVKDLYHSAAPDLVVVTVNEVAIAEITHQCIEYPWTILIEKPPGLDLIEADGIEQHARSAGRKVYVGMNRWSYSVTQHVHRALGQRDGIRFVHVQDQEDPIAAARAGKPERSVAHWMFANSIHLIDYFRIFTRGDPAQVQILQPWQRDRPCVVLAQIEFSSGDLGLYQAVWNGPGPWAVSVTVPGERWELRPLEQGVYQRLGDKPVSLEVHPWDHLFKPGFRYQAEQAVRAVLREDSKLPMIHDLLPTMRLIQAIYCPD